MRVRFEHAEPRVFDLVIGADGLHSQVRGLVFGAEERFEKYLGYKVAVFEAPGGPELRDVEAQKALLRERFSTSGWECPRILEAMESSDTFYFDRVSQIRMNSWTKGRTGLVGDAAFCVSLLAGQGSALAMVAAYVLAGELKAASGDHEKAFARYQENPRRIPGRLPGTREGSQGEGAMNT